MACLPDIRALSPVPLPLGRPLGMMSAPRLRVTGARLNRSFGSASASSRAADSLSLLPPHLSVPFAQSPPVSVDATPSPASLSPSLSVPSLPLSPFPPIYWALNIGAVYIGLLYITLSVLSLFPSYKRPSSNMPVGQRSARSAFACKTTQYTRISLYKDYRAP